MSSTKINQELPFALKAIMQSAENWACSCEISGEGVNNAASVACRHARSAIAKAEMEKNSC